MPHTVCRPRYPGPPALAICGVTGKQIHPTERTAQRAARGVQRRTNDHRPINVFRCRRCDGWHFGHASPMRRPR